VSADDLGELSMLDLFRMEADAQVEVLTSGMLALERDATAADQLELCMRAAHSLKGAARIVGLDAGIHLAHAMEDCFVAAQQGTIVLRQQHIDRLLSATDLLVKIAHAPEEDQAYWTDEAPELTACLAELALVAADDLGPPQAVPVTSPEPQPEASTPEPATPETPKAEAPKAETPKAAAPKAETVTAPMPSIRDNSDRILRVSADNLNRLLGLAGESLVESRWIKPFAESLLRLKRTQQELSRTLDGLRHASSSTASDEDPTQIALATATRLAQKCQHALADRLAELETFDRRSLNLAHRLYDSARECRMRPFGDGVQAYPRMVRDVAQSLGKQVRLEITGEATQVDRDVLVKLDAPLGHLLRNAVDHGIESPDQRAAAGKPRDGVIRLTARHSKGALLVSISDDGHGIDVEKIRDAVVARRLLSREAADKLTDVEIFEFLFLPGFSMKTTVTEVSGRGVGLDVVRDMVKQVRGIVRVSSQPGKGTEFLLELPVTLSVVRALIAEIDGEPYAFPLAAIVRTLKLPSTKIAQLEGRQHVEFDGRRIGLVAAHQVLGLGEPAPSGDEVAVIVLGDHAQIYGLVVDRFLGERELVLHRLDPQLGKIKDISAGALMEDGSPVLIIDPDDLLRSTDRLVSDGRLNKIARSGDDQKKRKRILVVDDSLTVRELERKLLGKRGYDVEIAVDGMDGWNAVRTGNFDLVVTDVDMPRMDGIELVKLINNDPRLKTKPVMVVSYKDRDEDRRRGLEAGAAYYLTKGSFQDQTFVQAVVDLIGEAVA
jgi:two-component system, chemotaxis family, sensor histidine kinase and response regulator WspE